MIFFDEFKEILNSIKKEYDGVKMGRNIYFELLQRQVIVIFGFYGGLRKNELRTREIADLYIFEKDIYIDVNNNGLRKQKLKLKSITSKRRIKLSLDEESLSIVNEWYAIRTEKLKNNSNYLFLSKSNKGTYLNSVIKEKEFDKISVIIKKVTNRYCTFHSLRHSFATYKMQKIIKGTPQPYSLIDLSVELGHVTPEITLASYCHSDLIKIMSYNI